MKKQGLRLVALLVSLVLLCGCTTAPKQEQKSSSSFDKETDLLIIGGGVAGLTGAIEASDAGCENILVVEKLAVLGGSAFVSGGILGGYETQVTKALDLHVDPKDMYNDQMQEKKFILDPDLTWLTTEKSGETIDWLIDAIKVPFQKDVIIKPGYGNFQTIHLVEGEGPGMRDPYMKAIEARPNIKIETETKAVELIVENDKVVGAIVEQGGKTIRVGAKAVILATGGYSSNHDLMAAVHTPNQVFQASAVPWSTGDGLIMATKIGAGVQNLDQIQVYLREVEDMRSQMPYMFNIFVGMDGKRFMDEKRVAQTYNQEIKDDIIELYGKQGVNYFLSINDQAAMDMFNLTETAKEHPGMTIANTLDELAEATGMDATGLKETVAKWNELVASGADSEYNRNNQTLMPIGEGPYYALKTTFFSSVCHGGITKNANGEVTRFGGSIIEGLYAAGEVTTVTNSNGYTISNAITFGRIAANNAISYIKGK